MQILRKQAGRFSTLGWGAVWTMCFVVSGCGSSTPQSAPVNTDQAIDTLILAPDAWKNGDKPESLQEREPKVVVQDVDWSEGLKLSKYLIGGKPVARDANWIAQVKLTLKDKAGKQSEKDVTYVVGTSPARTVFRDMLK